MEIYFKIDTIIARFEKRQLRIGFGTSVLKCIFTFHFFESSISSKEMSSVELFQSHCKAVGTQAYELYTYHIFSWILN